MAVSAASIIETICPELSGSPSLQVYLGMAVETTDRRFYGSLYEQAVAYRAAHLFTVMNGTSVNETVNSVKELGGGAPVASVSEGKLAVSFSQSGVGSDAAGLSSTKYGRALLGLKKSRPRMGANSRMGGLMF
jgi:hypothetical protein